MKMYPVEDCNIIQKFTHALRFGRKWHFKINFFTVKTLSYKWVTYMLFRSFASSGLIIHCNPNACGPLVRM